MSILIGSTGYVGSSLANEIIFDKKVHKSDISSIAGKSTDLLVCAGLPAEKWRANASPADDWANVQQLAANLSSVHADTAVLISTIDVYQPPQNVDENVPPNYSGIAAYGTNRAWFESFFQTHFQNSHILRLPGLFSINVRKNLIHDLIYKKEDQWNKVGTTSEFQFFNLEHLPALINIVRSLNIKVLNVSSEPVKAQEVADVFNVLLKHTENIVRYDMKTIHAEKFGGKNGYIYTREQILNDIRLLKTKIIL